MDLKTYRGSSMAEALAEVKKDLGKDAVILHARTTKSGGVLGFGGTPMVEITAAPADASTRPPARRADRATRSNEGFLAADWKQEADPALASLARATGGVAAEGGASSGRRSAVTELSSSNAELDPLMVRNRPVDVATISPRATNANAKGQATSGITAANIPVPAKSDRLSSPVRLAPESQAAWSSLEDELTSIKRLVGQVLQCARRGPTASSSITSGSGVVNLGGMAPALFDHYMLLMDAGIDTAVAEQIAGAVRDELEPAELADSSIVRNAVLRRLAMLLPTKASATPGMANGPLTIALVGPTGVGKTTTIAKLAATYKLRHGRRVGLITSDTYRIAAVDQLRTYANIIGLPLKVALTPQEMASARASLADCDVLLVDTAGRAPTDSARLDELRKFVDAARPDEVHLTLSAASSEPVLLRAAERFRGSVLQPSHVLFTKLDEAVTLGGLVNIAPKVGLPIGYVTTGQEVPDQIEIASSERLARLVLQRGDEVAAPAGSRKDSVPA